MTYASLAAYSAFWWGFAVNGRLTTAGFIYVAAVALLTAGLLLAGLFLRKRYGDLELDRLHGLARPMPRFAALFSLLVMAAVGLPPFALFSAHMQMLLLPLGTISWGLTVILLTSFLASWYLVENDAAASLGSAMETTCITRICAPANSPGSRSYW